ncbi:signal transduction histidine kinase/CheY-like chemotaxis protein [Rhizobium sp. BK529]|uniref:ATP-binding protein n=1 Tax=Rhizobium sp. BK529 TaxID=2586983 RepID=UPI0017B5C6AB|nr:ATP-binding protein [Rhizobium sp. BK529]MBB3595922.1 signal transduction histidine kinase/CheY-like chemotaxis protein [Rhizobium sp. BK529]
MAVRHLAFHAAPTYARRPGCLQVWHRSLCQIAERTTLGYRLNRARPALLLLSASLIPVIILAAAIGWLFVAEQRRALDDEVRARAETIATAVQRELNTQIQLLSVIADSPRFDLPISRSSFAETARRLRERVPAWDQIRVSDEAGNVVLALPPLDPSASRRVIDVESHDRLLKSQEAVIGNVVIGQKGQPAFAIRVPIERKDRLRAVLSAIVRPAMVTDLLRAGVPDTWPAWIVDGQDRLVASTGAADLAGAVESEYARLSAADAGSATLKGGDDLHIAEATLKETPWRVKVGIPVAEYDRLARKALLLLVASCCFTLLLAGAAAFLLQREVNARNRERESVANWQRMDALGKLTGQAAHDFNNLLMVFQSGIEGIKRRRNDEQRVTQLLGHMSDGVAKGKVITQRLLSFSRRSNQGAAHVELELKLSDLKPLLRQALNDAVVMDVNLPEDLWPVYVDPAGLEIALINLLTNAREAMPNGGRVIVSARNVPEGVVEDPTLRGAFVALSVTDTGKGVDPPDLTRVFEPFFSTKENGRAGLGLTQVHSFARAAGGAVKVSSLAGRGSAFTLLLPKSNATRVPKEGTNTVLDLPKTVLIVDDTPASLDSVRLALDGFVQTILTAASGAEALAILRSHPDVQAVISDVMMPEMSGIELAEVIARDYPRLAVVLMTGYSDQLEAGANVTRPVVAKPFRNEELAAALTTEQSKILQLSNVVRLDTSSRS